MFVNGHEVGSDKYKYKLAWMNDVKNFIKKDMKKTKYYLILGDFNIAPNDEDIYDPKAWKENTL